MLRLRACDLRWAFRGLCFALRFVLTLADSDESPGSLLDLSVGHLHRIRRHQREN